MGGHGPTLHLYHTMVGDYRVLAAKFNGVVNAVFNSFVLKVKSRLVILLGDHFYNTEALKLRPFQIITFSWPKLVISVRVAIFCIALQPI